MAWYDLPDDEEEQLGARDPGYNIPTPLNRQGPDLQAMPSPAPDNSVPAPDTSTSTSTRQRVVPGMPLPPDGAGIPSPDDSSSTPKIARPTTAKERLAQAMQNIAKLSSLDKNDDARRAYYHTDSDTGEMQQDSVLKSLGKGLLLSMRNIAPIMLDRNVSDKTALGYALGAGLAGSISNAATKGGAYDKVQLAKEQKDAQDELTSAQEGYSTDVKNRIGESNINILNAKPGQVDAANQIKSRKVSVDEMNASTKRLNSIDYLIKNSIIDRKNNPALESEISKIVGAPVKIDTFDPAQDTVQSVHYEEDGEGNRVAQVTMLRNGQSRTAWLVDPETGKPADIKSTRVKAAEIAGTTSTTNTQTRAAVSAAHDASQERIANLRSRTEIETKQMGLDGTKEIALLKIRDKTGKDIREDVQRIYLKLLADPRNSNLANNDEGRHALIKQAIDAVAETNK